MNLEPESRSAVITLYEVPLGFSSLCFQNSDFYFFQFLAKKLAEVQTIDDAKNLMDLAAAAKHYAKKHRLSTEAITFANSIEVSAEIKLGEILMEMEKNKGGGDQKSDHRSTMRTGDNDTPTIKEMGISKNLSSESQALASLPEEDKEKLKVGKMTKKKGRGKVQQKKKAGGIADNVAKKVGATRQRRFFGR